MGGSLVVHLSEGEGMKCPPYDPVADATSMVPPWASAWQAWKRMTSSPGCEVSSLEEPVPASAICPQFLFLARRVG